MESSLDSSPPQAYNQFSNRALKSNLKNTLGNIRLDTFGLGFRQILIPATRYYLIIYSKSFLGKIRRSHRKRTEISNPKIERQ